MSIGTKLIFKAVIHATPIDIIFYVCILVVMNFVILLDFQLSVGDIYL